MSKVESSKPSKSGKSYVPEAGDIVWIDLEPVVGHEQGKHRPAIVLSEKTYNGATGLMTACAITSVEKGYPFEVALSETNDVVLADQIRTLDWRARGIKFKGKAASDELNEVRKLLAKLIGIPTVKPIAGS